MDSVSQKQNYLSLTGIDQLTEATDNIETLQKQVKDLYDNVKPNYVSTDYVDQLIKGKKSFESPITTTGLNTLSISTIKNMATNQQYPIEMRSSDPADIRNTLTYDTNAGVTIKGPLTINNSDTVQSKVIIKGALEVLNPPQNNAIIKADTISTNALAVTTQLVVKTGSTITPSLSADSAAFKTLTVGSGPILNVAVPFQPTNLDGVTGTSTALGLTQQDIASDVCFFAGANFVLSGTYANATTSIMTRYLYPRDYMISHISAMFDTDTAIETNHLIELKIYNNDGTGTGTTIGFCNFLVLPTLRCACQQLRATVNPASAILPPVKVLSTQSLGGTHRFIGPVLDKQKECFYIIHGYQV